MAILGDTPEIAIIFCFLAKKNLKSFAIKKKSSTFVD